MRSFRNFATAALVALIGIVTLLSTGCGKTEAKPPAPQALPVKIQVVGLHPVARTVEYVATAKSRRSATIQPQVDGALMHVLVMSGHHVRAGNVLMTIDLQTHQATVK